MSSESEFRFSPPLSEVTPGKYSLIEVFVEDRNVASIFVNDPVLGERAIINWAETTSRAERDIIRKTYADNLRIDLAEVKDAPWSK